MNRVFRNKVSGVEGVLIRKANHSLRGDVFIIKTSEGREYFGPAHEFEFVRYKINKTSHLL